MRVLVDGNRLPTLKVMAEAIVKGDALVPAISAASILAKVTRDRWCAEVDAEYPHYGFATHKGYGTTAHLEALRSHGACPRAPPPQFQPGERGAGLGAEAGGRAGAGNAVVTAPAIIHITSRDNPLLKELRKLSQESTAYRKQGRVWLEGDHLCRAALARGKQPAIALFSESIWPAAQAEYGPAAIKTVVLPDVLFAELSGLESPARMGFVLDLPQPAEAGLLPGAAAVLLDRVQDAGNVGSILRSASAFGFAQVIALKGTAALWSAKVLRAGMGAHFALRLVESVEMADLEALDLPLLVTSSHGGSFLHQADLPWPCAWVMGHEGQGVSAALEARAAQRIRIAQPGGEESLNVGAAAAICLHASAARRSP